MFIKIAMVVESGENLIGYLRNKNSGFKLEKKEIEPKFRIYIKAEAIKLTPFFFFKFVNRNPF